VKRKRKLQHLVSNLFSTLILYGLAGIYGIGTWLVDYMKNTFMNNFKSYKQNTTVKHSCITVKSALKLLITNVKNKRF